MEKMKYVKVGEYNSIIIFPFVIQHSEFKRFNPTSAGFCHISKDKVVCFGESVSLGLKADEVLDTIDATKQYCGHYPDTDKKVYRYPDKKVYRAELVHPDSDEAIDLVNVEDEHDRIMAAPDEFIIGSLYDEDAFIIKDASYVDDNGVGHAPFA